jgi:AraC family transcriptional regulator of adaptative response/methylated-DNA-[protein]-cysteine methyltransferase
VARAQETEIERAEHPNAEPIMTTALALAPRPHDDHRGMTAAIEYLVRHYREHPSLDEVAARIGMSPFHFQRTFKRWTGISPKRFEQYLTLGDAKQRLELDTSLLEAAYGVGLSGPSRLHDLFVACEAVTPGDFKARGRGLTIHYAIHDSPFGRAVLGLTERGICHLSFVVDGDETAALDVFAQDWPEAERVLDPAGTAPIAERAFRFALGNEGRAPRLLLRGTNFEIKVWEALLRIPSGSVASYQQVAAAIGDRAAVRAVGRAVGANPISLLIPCHRVILKSGVVHAYRWGVGRKKVLLALERARRETAA